MKKFLIIVVSVIVICFIIRYKQTHYSNVARAELVVDTIIFIDGKWMVRFEEKEFCGHRYIQHPYARNEINFSIGDTLTIDCDTVTGAWLTSMKDTRFNAQMRIYSRLMKKMQHEKTRMMNGYVWNE